MLQEEQMSTEHNGSEPTVYELRLDEKRAQQREHDQQTAVVCGDDAEESAARVQPSTRPWPP